ncbi:8-amino-7-oxononanoate synthase [Terrabacter terrigena]|uniref:8-amino-7-oxononanoate synthase n=1 Tax=Terrabacter terrigena TaxID=574718 RepID=A0ABW3MRQ3_9MICO
MSDVWGSWLRERAELRAERGVERFDPVLRLGGRLPGGHDALDLASNDYLGLARDERVVAAAHDALDRYGASATASRLVTGTLPVHRDLEAALCRLTGQPSALAFSTGYAANLGVLTALSGRGAEILLDAHAHASLHDAARMSRVPYATFAHNDAVDLDRELAARPGRRVVVAVESIYSVLGDAAPLTTLVEVCRRHDALLVVDEAHGIGVAGRGRGLVHSLGLVGATDVVVTMTLSKALGSQGGAVLGSTALRNHLVNTARSFIFDTGLAPAAAGAATTAADLVVTDPSLADAVRANAQVIASLCGVEQSAGAVQSLPMPSPEAAVAACLDLRAEGVLVGCFRPPSVPDGVSRLRVTARADVTGEDLLQAAGRVARVARVARQRAPRPEGGAAVERSRAVDAPSTARGLPTVAAVEGPQDPASSSPLAQVPPHDTDG